MNQPIAQLQQHNFVSLVVLDGFGVAPRGRGNAVTSAKMPFYQSLLQSYPYANLQAAGEAVGLPWGEMGNSEVGHMNLGLGRIAYQDLPRINNSIRDGSFFQNPAFIKAIEHVKKFSSKLHLVGLVSDGGVHALDEHLYQLLSLAKQEGLRDVKVHAILDGRDTPPKSGVEYLQRFLKTAQSIGIGEIASCGGRYFAMDRDNRWERIEKAYQAIVFGAGPKTNDPLAYIMDQYKSGKTDEDMEPFVITNEVGGPIGTINKNDAVIFFNFRTDRARQLTEAFVLPGFEKFDRKGRVENLFFVTMVAYESGLPVEVAFPEFESTNALAKVLSDSGLRQLHIAETEKYAHITNFFDGALGVAYPGEEFSLVPSPPVKQYDQQPEMSAIEITQKALQEIGKGIYNFVVINYANPDMVGHTGNFPATVTALEVIDRSLQEIVMATLALEGVCIITGDHGNAEEMIDLQSGEITKEHTNNPVPFLYVANDSKLEKSDASKSLDPSAISPIGILSDVAPTILDIFGLQKPAEMTGRSLLPIINSIKTNV